MTPPEVVFQSLRFEQTAPDTWIYVSAGLDTWLVEHDPASGYHLSVLQASSRWHTVLVVTDERYLSMALGGVLQEVWSI